MTLSRDKIDSIVEEHQDKIFQDIDDARGDMPPSEVRALLEADHSDLAEAWQTWWEEGDEPWT